MSDFPGSDLTGTLRWARWGSAWQPSHTLSTDPRVLEKRLLDQEASAVISTGGRGNGLTLMQLCIDCKYYGCS